MANRSDRHRRLNISRAPTDIQKRCPIWVGTHRHRFGIRAHHPWRDWPLRRIAGLAPDWRVPARVFAGREKYQKRLHQAEERAARDGERLTKELRAVQVALAGWGIRP